VCFGLPYNGIKILSIRELIENPSNLLLLAGFTSRLEVIQFFFLPINDI